MDILIIGGGGREHALAYALKKSPKVEKIYCLPGNGGISQIAECAPIGVMEFDKIIEFLKQHPSIGITVVGPDDPLAAGIVDELQKHGFKAFGPCKEGRHDRGEQVFCQELNEKIQYPHRFV